MNSEKKVGVGFGIMLLKGSKVLLGKRHSDPTKADSDLHGEGTWTMPGGKLHFGESFEDGVYREVREETGIEVDKSSLKLISVSNDRVLDAHYVTVGFICESFIGEPQVKEPDEIVEWHWFPLDALPYPIYFPSQGVIESYLHNRIYKA